MKTPKTLARIVEEHNPELHREEIDRFQKMQTLREAIKTAAESRDEGGNPYPHQLKHWNFWPNAVRKATKILVAAEAEIGACSSFAEIHDLVKAKLAKVSGVKVLYWYDVSVRIGAYLGYLPEKVYLHAGTLEGAKRLGLPTEKGYLEMDELPAMLQAFKPYEVEDMLCWYAEASRHKGAKKRKATC